MSENDNELAIDKFKSVISYFDKLYEQKENTVLDTIPLVGKKRQRENDEIAQEVSNLDKFRFLAHKNIATSYFEVCKIILNIL